MSESIRKKLSTPGIKWTSLMSQVVPSPEDCQSQRFLRGIHQELPLDRLKLIETSQKVKKILKESTKSKPTRSKEWSKIK